MAKQDLNYAIKARTDYATFKNTHGDSLNWKRVNSCQAWYALFGSGYLLKSYKTIVAFYSLLTHTLYIYGRYSSTTYQHVRKFETIMKREYLVNETVNLELENWFK